MAGRKPSVMSLEYITAPTGPDAPPNTSPGQRRGDADMPQMTPYYGVRVATHGPVQRSLPVPSAQQQHPASATAAITPATTATSPTSAAARAGRPIPGPQTPLPGYAPHGVPGWHAARPVPNTGGSTSPTPSPSDVLDPLNSLPRRPPRPTYTEEQKFYIMYSRIMLYKSWPEISQGYCALFGSASCPRTLGGLTSVYYRIRKDWGLADVLKTDADTLVEDKKEMVARARLFSKQFLESIGYFDTPPHGPKH